MKQHRIDSPEVIDPASVAKLIDAGERVIVQYSKRGYSSEQLSHLNQMAKIHGRHFEVRFYGHYSDVFDASVLQLLPDVQCVSIDCLVKASNLEALSGLHNLAELSLGVFELDDASILRYCNRSSLQMLSLGDTRKCNIDLGQLVTCGDLKRLHTTGHTRNIQALCNLSSLRDLSLSSIKRKDDIGFVSTMRDLRALRLILGGRVSIAQLTAPRLESLEIIRVQGLEDIGDLGRFENLERLSVEDQLRMTRIRVGANSKLADVGIVNCKNLKTIEGIEGLTALSSLRIYKTAIDYEEFVSRSLPDRLETCFFGTGSSKRDSEIRNDLEKRALYARVH